jgi:hypothetical protein
MPSTVPTWGRARWTGDQLSVNLGRRVPRVAALLPAGSTLGGVNRRILTLMVALVPIVVFGVLLAVVTVPYVSLGPGRPTPLVRWTASRSGHRRHPDQAHLRAPEHDDGVPARRADPGARR